MAKNLVIVESPAKAKTIEKFLGKDYKVASSFGHIADLPSKELGVNVKGDFQTKEIWRDFTRLAIISKPNIQITQNKNSVEANCIAYHIIVNFVKTDVQRSQKKCSFNDALLLTHVVVLEI